jgi:GT2 family glycosyltransferase
VAGLAPRLAAVSNRPTHPRIGRVAIVVPNWNGAARLRPCVRSLAAQDRGDLEIIVVENGSTDESMAVLDEMVAEVAPVTLTVLRNDTNLGFAGGVNRGIRHAMDFGFDAIALFNNDAVADRRWLGHLVSELDARADAGIATGRLLMADGATVDSTGDFYTTWGLAFPRDRDQPAEVVRPSGYVFAASGGASLFRTALFRDIGLFDEKFFAYFEDVDFSFRAQLAGHRVFYTADAVAYHDQGATSRSMSGFGTTQFFRNLPMVLVKDVPAAMFAPVAARFALVYTLMVVNSFRRGEGGPAVKGALRAVGFVARHGLGERRRVQRGKRVSSGALRDQLWRGLPPGMRVLRGTRDRLRRRRGAAGSNDGGDRPSP